MFRATLTRAGWGKHIGASAFAWRSRSASRVYSGPLTVLASQPRLFSYAPALLQKQGNSGRKAPTAGALSSKTEHEKDTALLTSDDDLMVGHEGLETIDPKDFPELYPHDEALDGLSQALHPDDERDYEGLEEQHDTITIRDNRDDRDVEGSVLLSDKQRTEDEFAWFVDENYPDKTLSSTGENQTSTHEEAGFVPLWQKNAQRTADGQQDGKVEGHDERLELLHGKDGESSSVEGLVRLLESERARHVKVIDMRDKCDWTNWMVIAEGLSERHLGNVADQVYRALKNSLPKSSPPVMEGRDTSDWIVIDAGSVVIHFMTPEARKERDLEGLWASVKSPLKLKDTQDITWDDVKGKMTKSWKENPGRSKGEDGKRGRRGEKDIPLSEVVKW
ncbi:hypothetical protein BGZ94_010359 [Podila epigama]|nr:hypothetical protein BGZ94_010359 [Podila epigama]